MTDWEDTIAPEWEEPRGPHLPDTLTRVPLAVWPFVAFAIALAYITVDRNWTGRIVDQPALPSFVLSLIPIVAMPLAGAALFLRHPHAWSRHRPVALAVILLTAQTVVQVATPIAFDLIAPSDPLADPSLDDVYPWFSWALGLLSSAIGLLGVAYCGWRSTRRAEGRAHPTRAGSRSHCRVPPSP
jgi:hypothetical protein